VALLVFGPRRLPEIARRAGRFLRRASDAAAEMKAGLESEYEDTLRPLADVRREMRTTLQDLATDPDRPPAAGPQSSPDEDEAR
jgi:Sec-independent protein translocase protein TatA